MSMYYTNREIFTTKQDPISVPKTIQNPSIVKFLY